MILLVGSNVYESVEAFQRASPAFSQTPPTTIRESGPRPLKAVPLGDVPIEGLINPQELTAHAQALHGFLEQHHHQTSLLLADAAAAIPVDAMDALEATTDAAVVAADEGWWAAYLNIFKTTIEFVHSGIDGPIHKLGWQGGTWGFSIALFTAGVRSLLIPLSFQQTKTTEMTKALQPYIKEINEKFKDNETRKNQLVGKLYEDANQNPLSGCLLSLLQLPLILGLYRGVRLLAIDGKLDEPFLWIPSLEGPVTAETDYRGMDWLTQGWTQIDGTWTPQLGWETTLAFCIMPVVLVLGQRLTMEALQPPEEEDSSMDEKAKEQMETTKTVLKFLPLLIGFFSLQVPAALTIYWFTSNFFTLSQALIVRKYYEQNPPEIQLPEYWDQLGDDENTMTPEERRAAAKAGIAKGPKIEDWIANSKFHTLVERDSESFSLMRQNYETWKEQQDGKVRIPPEFQAWVETPIVLGSSEEVEAKKEEAVPQTTA